MNPGWLTCLALAFAVTPLSCGDGDGPIVVPDELESSFSFRDDAFTFLNFAENAEGAGLDSELVARMFDPKVACENGETPCMPTLLADTWRRGVNETLYEGRSEGIAVLAQLMSMGEIDPNDFGAATAAELRLEGNQALQRELAYWAAIQNVPSALEQDTRFAAKDVMPFLTEALDPKNKERYRLAIAVRTPAGFVRGHGLVPIGFYRVAPDDFAYRLRVYDNNFPAAERELVIDVAANTWRYEAPMPSGKVVVYEGTAENGNLLYFSPIRQRLGTQRAPFEADAQTASLTSAGSLQVSASIGEGETAGVEDGVVVERGSGRLVPAFASCTLCNPSRGIVNYTLKNDLKKDLVVNIAPGKRGDGEGSDGVSKVSVTGSNFATEIKGVDTKMGTTSSLRVEPDGDLTFSSNGNTDVNLSSTRVVSGNESKTSVVVSGNQATGGTMRVVKVTIDDQGRPTVDATGLPAGSSVQVTYAVVDKKTGETKVSTVTVPVANGATQLKIDPDTGTVRSVSEVCTNGKFDEAFEVDADCGDACTAGCDIGQMCSEQADCFDRGVTPTGGILCLTDAMDQLRCIEQGCDDGHKTGHETDRDCGSINGQSSGCEPCAATNTESAPACDSDDDCDSGACRSGCRTKNRISIDFQGMPVGAVRQGWAVIDLKTYKFAEAVVTEGDTLLELPDGYIYSIYIDNFGSYSCFPRKNGVLIQTSRFEGHTGYDPNQPGVFDRDFVLECAASTGALRLTSSGIPDGVDVGLAFSHTRVEGSSSRVEESVVISEDGASTFTAFSGNWDLSVNPQPGQVRVGGVQYYDECLLSLDMEAASARISGYLNRGGQRDVALACTRHSCPYDGLCDGALTVNVVGLAAEDSFRLQDSTGKQQYVLQNGPIAGFSTAENKTWTIVDAPGQRGEGANKTFTECLFSDGSLQKTLTVGELDVQETITCTKHACPYLEKCDGNLYVATTGLVAGLNVSVTQASTVNISANGTTSFGAGRGTRQLQVTKQPGEHLVSTNKFYNQCLWSNATTSIGATVAGADVTETLTCTDHACPYQNYCSTAVNVDVQGMPTGVSIDLRATVGGQVTTHSPTGSGTVKLLDGTGNYTLAIVSQPGVVAVAGGDAHVACEWANETSSTSGTLTGESLTLVLSCTATMCPDALCAQSCTTDSDCNSDNCECGINSGNCTGATGACGKLKKVFDDPTTDGTTATGTFTVPSLCNQVFIQAWGAAGGSSDAGGGIGPGLGNPGGASGYVSGKLSVVQGDVITVWVGQGGAYNDTGPGGTPSIGSNVGTLASGGVGDADVFGGGSGGGGGGLTSFQQTGSVNRTVLIPGGGGASSTASGGDVGTAGGGTEATSTGGAAVFGSVGGGGGAGEYGGAGSQSGEAGLPGSYSTLPAGLMSTDPTGGVVPNADANDYSACLGIDGSANAGSAGSLGMVSSWGGDGCVVIRCVGY